MPDSFAFTYKTCILKMVNVVILSSSNVVDLFLWFILQEFMADSFSFPFLVEPWHLWVTASNKQFNQWNLRKETKSLLPKSINNYIVILTTWKMPSQYFSFFSSSFFSSFCFPLFSPLFSFLPFLLNISVIFFFYKNIKYIFYCS